MEEYEKLFKDFKDKSNEILEALYNEDYDKLNAALSEREKILANIEVKNFGKDIFEKMDEELNIKATEVKIKALLNEKMNIVKGEIQKLQLTSKANNSYNKGFYDRNKIFSKKV